MTKFYHLILGIVLAVLCLGATKTIADEVGQADKKSDTSPVWVLFIPHRGDYVGGFHLQRVFEVDPDRKIKLPSHDVTVISLLAIITIETHVQFIVEGDLARCQYSLALENFRETEISIGEALRKVVRAVEKTRYDIPPANRQEKAFRSNDRRKVYLRCADITDPKGIQPKKIIGLSLSTYQVKNLIESLPSLKQGHSGKSAESRLAEYLKSMGAINPVQCNVDEVLQAIWLKIPGNEIESLNKIGL